MNNLDDFLYDFLDESRGVPRPAGPNFFSKIGFSRLNPKFLHKIWVHPAEPQMFSKFGFSWPNPNFFRPPNFGQIFFHFSFEFSRLNPTFFFEFSHPTPG